MTRPLLILTALLGAGVAAFAQPAAEKLPKRANCLVDGKTLTVTPELPRLYINDSPRFFCTAACRTKFAGWPEKYFNEVVKCTVQPQFKGFIQLSRRVEVNNGLYYLCCEPCVGYMRQSPWDYVAELPDPVSGKWFKISDKSPRSAIKAQQYLFESSETKAAFDKEPTKYAVEFRR